MTERGNRAQQRRSPEPADLAFIPRCDCGTLSHALMIDGVEPMQSASAPAESSGAPGASATPKKQRRQLGTDRHFGGGPIIAAPPGRGIISAARFALFFTGVAWFAYIIEQVLRLRDSGPGVQNVAETAVYTLLVTMLTVSALAYLLARLGYFNRIKNHRRVPRSAIDDYFDDTQPSVTVIVPSYREDARIIRQTLLSAALQEYPGLRVVLLVDDPPNPADTHNRELLRQARALPGAIREYLDAPRKEFEKALAAFDRENATGHNASASSLKRLAAVYGRAADWFSRESSLLERVDHSDHFVAIEFFDRMRKDLRATADAILYASDEPQANVSRRRVRQLYQRLVRIFAVEIDSFERKQFASLSHEANKAMNLNSYIGLMGGRFNVVASPGGRVLVPAGSRTPDLVVPNADYVLTLDADSVLLPEYCLRLVYFMEQEENSDVAVVQTPYSAFRGAASRIERIAGATTDIQHIVHQGLTQYDATFWVGANAVIRKLALDELEEEESEGGFVIRRYIKDRTVIEDTESSVDLRSHGWRLHNYPERLSYSATPPDFGSLVIQRQRWANGGLVILPKLWRLLRTRDRGVPRPSLTELFLRTSYLASISWSSVGLLLLLFYPFNDDLLSRFAVLTALPYFIAMSSDLKRVGYRRTDIFRIYGFNLLLLPVNLAGTVQSIIQAIGGQKMAFARTPKVRDRTVAPLMFVLLPVFLIAWSARTLLRDIDQTSYIHGTFALTNLSMTLYACVAFVGPRAMLVDIVMNTRAFLYRPVTVSPKAAESPHWASVIYVGSSILEDVKRNTPLAAALAAHDHQPDRARPSRSDGFDHGVRPESAAAAGKREFTNSTAGVDLV